VYPSETVRELCERCLVNPLEKNLPEVTWGNTNLPLSERLTHLNATKPWQLNLAKGEEELLITVPAGVAIRSKPLRSRRAASGAESDAAAVPTFSKSREKRDADDRGDGEGDERPGKAQRRLPDATADVMAKPTTDFPSSDEGKKRDETNPAVSDEPAAFETAEAAAKARATEDLAEDAAAGLMAVASGLPMQKKRGRGRPRKIPEQGPPRTTRDVPPVMRRDGYAARSVGADVEAMSPVLLAAYDAGRADAAAAALAASAALAAPPVSVSAPAGANPPSVADIIDKFYKHRPSTTADKAFPLDSFRAAAGGGLASAGVGVASLDAGSAANNKALWQWNQTLATLSGQAGHPAGAFVDPSSPYASLFAPPASPAELKRVSDANTHALSEVATSLEAVRRCSAAVAADGDSTDPSVRAALVAKLERALREAEEKKKKVPPSQRVEMAKTLVDLRAWIRAQLQARIRELAACAGGPAPELRGARGEKAALSKEKGKAPAEARAEETPAFPPLAAVAAASEDERGVSGGTISSDGDPSTE
jgi:hypothetical protein